LKVITPVTRGIALPLPAQVTGGYNLGREERRSESGRRKLNKMDIKTIQKKRAELKAFQAEWDITREEFEKKKADTVAAIKLKGEALLEATAKVVARIQSMPPEKRAELKAILGPKIDEAQKQLASLKKQP
jgi:hypothetical protein